MRRRPSPLLVLCALLCAAPPLLGQTTQYIAPGAGGRRPVDAREAMRAALDEARWRLGPLRLDPWLALDELAWVEPDGQDGDLTASAGIGLRGYVPVGSRVVLAAHTLPRYTWWRDRTESRHWGGEAGLGLFLYSNHLLVEVTAAASDLTAVVTPETDQRARFDSDRLEARAELPIGSRFSLFVRGGRGDTTAELDESTPAEFADLDRTESWLEGGVRWYLGNQLSLWLGAGTDEADFAETARDRSNEGSYELVELAWDRPKLGAALAAKRVRREATAGSEFGEFEDTTGSARISWNPRQRIGWSVYGLRQIGYPIFAAGDYFVEDRLGTSVTLGVGGRSSLTLFYESGEHDFRDGGPVEDLSTIGAAASLPLGRRFELRLGGRQTRADRGGVERETLEWRAGVSLGEVLGRWF